MARIYAYSSNKIYCDYTLSASRSGSTVTITASGTITGNGTSSDSASGQKLYVQLRYGVSPANTSGTGDISSYGTLLEDNGWSWTSSTSVGGYSGSTNTSRKIADNDSSSFPSLNGTGFPTSGRTFTVTWTATNNSALNLSNVALFFFREQNNATVPTVAARKVYTFVGKQDSSIDVKNVRYYTQSLSVGVGYTSCSAPTSVTVNKTIWFPYNSNYTGNKVIVSWSGASNGTSNNIAKYKIYWRYNAVPTTSTFDGSYTIDVIDGTTSGQWEINTFGSEALRGTQYYFKVQAIGTQSGYDSGISSVSGTIKCNTLPTTPVVTIASGATTINNTNYIKSTGSSVKFTSNATDNDGQTVTYYYATSSGGTKTAFTKNTSFSVSNNTTYYFWSFDTMEYSSSYSTISLTKNSAPNFTFNTGTTITYDNDNNSYVAGATSSVTGITATGTVSYKWGIQSNTSQSTANATLTSLTGSSSSLTWTYPGASLGWGKYYRPYCTVTDQVGDSTTKYDSSWYKIPNELSFENDIYNNWDYSNHNASKIDGSATNNFYQNIVIKPNVIDTGIQNCTWTITPSATIANESLDIYKNYGFMPFTITDTTQNATYTFSLTCKMIWGASVTKSYTIKRSGLPEITGGIYNASNIYPASSDTIEPFSQTSSFNIELRAPHENSNNNYINSSSTVKVYLYSGANEVEVANTTWNDPQNNVIIISTIRGSAADVGLYNWSTNILGLNLNGSNTVGLRAKFTDVFGQTYSVDKADYLTLNYIKLPSVTLQISKSSQTDVIKQNDTIIYTPTITAYNTDKTIDIKTYIYRSTANNTQQDGEWVLYSGTNTDNGEYWTPIRSTTNAAITKTSNYTYTVGEISESKYLFFKVVITPNGEDPISSDIKGYYISQRHTNSNQVEFNTIRFDTEELKLNYNFSLTNYGAGQINSSGTWTGIEQASYGIQFSPTTNFDSNNTKWLSLSNNVGSLSDNQTAISTVTSETSSYSKQNIDLSGLTAWSFYNVRVVYWTTIGNNIKTTYGISTILYNISPTISYRKNQIGININGIESNHQTAALVVGSTTGKNLIKLYSAGNTATINLDTGALDGFIIVGDAGSWD